MVLIESTYRIHHDATVKIHEQMKLYIKHGKLNIYFPSTIFKFNFRKKPEVVLPIPEDINMVKRLN